MIRKSADLTVTFVIAAGLSGVAKATDIVIICGTAEIAAGSIVMGSSGYLATRSDAEVIYQTNACPDLNTDRTYALEGRLGVYFPHELRNS